MNREAWLQERRKGLGASDMAAVCGLRPFGRTPLHVYCEKVEGYQDQANEQMRWGLKLEQVIADAYSETTGRTLEVPEPVIWWGKPLWMFATLDRITTGHNRVVELKNPASDQGWGAPGTDEIPAIYTVQVQQQMAVAECEVADLAVLFGGARLAVYTVRRNEDVIGRIEAMGRAFWEMVIERRRPEPEWEHPDTAKLIDRLNRPDTSEYRELGEDVMPLVAAFEEASAAGLAAELRRAAAKAKLVDRLGPAAVGLLPDGRRIVRSVSQVHEARPREYERFNFRISKRKEQ